MVDGVEKNSKAWNSMNISVGDAIEPGPKIPNATYVKLQAIEKGRRHLLKMVENKPWKIMTQCKGTILPLIAADPQMVFNLAIFIIVRIYNRQLGDIPPFIKGLDVGIEPNLKTIGNFLSFFLVFFVVQNNTRFTEMYGLCMSAKGSIISVASIARANLKKDQALRIVRYLNAAYAAGFTGLSDAYTYEGYFLEVNKQLKLLNGAELDRVAMCDMNAGGSCYREILQWVQVEITSANRAKDIDSQTAKLLRCEVLSLQSSMSKLYNFHDQPVIFFYIHFVVFVSLLYLPLFSFQAASKIPVDSSLSADIAAGILVFLQTIFVLGLLQLGQKLSDPFGLDYEDLSVMHYVNFTWRESGRILQSKVPIRSFNPNHNTEEAQMVAERAPIGEAWDLDLSEGDYFDEENFYESRA